MSKLQQRRPSATAARRPTPKDDPKRFAGRVKRWSLALSVGVFGLAWGLVSQNVVGATNATSTNGPADVNAAPHRATVPSVDFFGPAASQPQPILGNGGTGSGPIVRGRTS